MMLMRAKYDPEKQRGLLRVSHDQVHHVRASLALVRKVGEQPVVVRSIGVSGVLRKAESRYCAS